MAKQARRGGEIGINGEHYSGGQFMAGSETTVKGEHKAAKKAAKPSKQEIAPYVWEIAPEGQRAIYPQISAYCTRPVNNQIAIFAPARLHSGQFANQNERIISLVALWNAGERWTAV